MCLQKRSRTPQASTFDRAAADSLAGQIGTHYLMTFAKSRTLIHLSAIYNFTFLIIISGCMLYVMFYQSINQSINQPINIILDKQAIKQQ